MVVHAFSKERAPPDRHGCIPLDITPPEETVLEKGV